MLTGWKSVLEGVIAFEEVCEHDKNFLALIRGTGVDHILLERMDQGLESQGNMRAHHTCPPKVEGVLFQEFDCSRNLVGIGTRQPIRGLHFLRWFPLSFLPRSN